MALELVPIIGQLAQTWLFANAACAFLRRLEFRLDRIRARLRTLNAGIFCVKLPKRRMIFDRLVNQRLSNRRIIHFAVPMATIPDQVDHYIAVKLVAVIQRQAADANDRVNVFCINMEYRNILPAGELGGKAGRMQLT